MAWWPVLSVKIATVLLAALLLVREELIISSKIWIFKSNWQYPGQVAQLVRMSPPYSKVAGLIPGQGTYKKQPMNAQVSGKTNRHVSLSFSHPLIPLSLSF